MYDIQPLKTLALENLGATLAIFTLHHTRRKDIVELFRCVDGSLRSVPGVEDLRALMADYLGYEMDTLIKDRGFRELIVEDGGALLDDFMEMVEKRI